MNGIKRFFKAPKRHFFLFGHEEREHRPGFNKTISDSLYIDLLLADAFRLYSANPERLIKIMDAYSSTLYIF